MKRMACNKGKLNNRGMSLVEIIVAIAILSVAVIPLMYAFVNSMRNNARGRELQQTTVLAYTIIENCKADTMEEVEDNLSSGNFLFGVSSLQTFQNGDTYYLQNVPLENQKYDVAITFTPHEIASQTSYSILRTTGMNSYMDAMLHVNTPDNTTDPLATPTTMETMDADAYLMALEDITAGIKLASEDYIANHLPAGIGLNAVDLSTGEIEDSFESGGTNAGNFSLKRDALITIDESSGEETVTVMFTYSYEVMNGYKYDFVYDYIDPSTGTLVTGTKELVYSPSSSVVSYTYEIFSNSSSGASLENIYMLYYPAYPQVTGLSLYPFGVDSNGFSEHISINNNLPDGREVNLYLVKQINPTYGTDALGVAKLLTLENSYAVKVSATSPNGAVTNLYHNLWNNLGDATATPVDKSASWFSGVTQKSMVEKDNKELMYDFVVQIYRAGSYETSTNSMGSNASLVLTMDGTDLDW